MRIMIKLFASVMCSAILFACNNRGINETASSQHANEMYVEMRPFKNARGWGYNIYVDKKLYISQSVVPGVAGANGFKTKEEAARVGKLAVYKMSTEKRRPVITEQELIELHIIPSGKN